MKHVVALGVLIAMAAPQVVQAAPNSPERVAAFAELEDWKGIWELDFKGAQGTADAPVGYADTNLISLAQKPPYNEAWEAKRLKMIEENPDLGPAGKVCSFGYPGMMAGPHLFQMFVYPEEVLIVARGDELRHVYTDGRDHPVPEDLWPTPMGDSIGHWEEDGTLVIDTIAREEGPVWTDPRLPISGDARFVERIKMITPDRIRNEITIIDPTALSRTWTITSYYNRVTDIDRMFYESCTANDRNIVVDGQMIIAPPR